MNFEQRFMAGFLAHEKLLDQFAGLASSVLGSVTWCAVVEVDATGHAFILGSRADFAKAYLQKQAFLFDPIFTYHKQTPEGFHFFVESKAVEDFYREIGQSFDIGHGFYFTEREECDTLRRYVFASNKRDLYWILANQSGLINALISQLKKKVAGACQAMRQHKFNLLLKKPTTFQNAHQATPTARESFIAYCRHKQFLLRAQTPPSGNMSV